MELMRYVIAALIVEALWETSKLFWDHGKLNIDRVGAVIFGELIAFTGGLDFMKSVGMPLSGIPYIGILLTGLLISRGANFMHDLISTISNVQTNTKAVKPK